MAERSDRQSQGRYVQGGGVEQYPRRIGWWERKVFETDVSDAVFTLTPKYDKRPDVLAYEMYGSARLQWFILQYNTIVDINEEFVTGKEIRLPLRSRLYAELLTKQQPLELPTEE